MQQGVVNKQEHSGLEESTRIGARVQRTWGQTTANTKVLKFEESSDIGHSASFNRRLTYIREGSNQTFVTNESNLKQKISQVLKSEETKRIKDAQIVSQQKEGPDGEEQKPKEAIIRYYTPLDAQSDQAKCRRCGQPGHFQKNCTEAESVRCYYCMGKHHIRECQQSGCHRCHQIGHLRKDCRQGSQRCHQCGSHGHRASHCGIILMDDVRGENGVAESRDLDIVICMSCHNQGHINCVETKQQANMYGQSQMEKEQKEQKKKIHQRFRDRQDEGHEDRRDSRRNRDRNQKEGHQRESQRSNRHRQEKERQRERYQRQISEQNRKHREREREFQNSRGQRKTGREWQSESNHRQKRRY